MSFYVAAKFLHIILAIAWLGGAFGMILLGTLAAKRGDQNGLIRIGAFTETLAKTVFLPATVLILLLGLYMVWVKWAFVEAWIIIGLIGIVLTGAMGSMVLTPMTTKLGAMPPGPEAAALAGKLLRTARADLVMLAVIVWDMVSKPAWSDQIEIAVMAAIVVGGGVLFLRR